MTEESCAGPKTHRIIIARHDNFVVRPGRLVVRRGDRVVWLALGANAHIFIPRKELFEGRVLDVADATDRVPDNISDSDLLKLRDDGVVNGFVVPDNVPYGVYPYSVFCDKPNAFAQGGSDPELIVGF